MLSNTLKPSTVGVFDSGLGGLSVLREIAHALPQESLLYLADSLHAPYGEKSTEFIEQRTLACCAWLVAQGAKTLVVACNTATMHTIRTLRERYPALPVVGVEPGLKPAVAASQSHIVGVLATERTLKSEKFNTLLAQQSQSGTRFICQAGKGLVPLVEAGEIDSPAAEELLRSYLHPMLEAGADTLVLGCTHYPFLAPTIQRICGNELRLIDTGAAVARRVQSLLAEHQILATASVTPQHRFCSTFGAEHLQRMLERLLHLQQTAEMVEI